jgi:hypothetical protein
MSEPTRIIHDLFKNGFYALALVSLIACNKTESPSTEAKNEFLLKTKRTDGKLLALNVRTSMQLYQVDNNKFPSYEKLKEIIEKSQKEEGGSVPLYYTFGTAESHPEVATACPDCKITDDTFKIAIFANLDDDNDLDIMYINNTELDVLQLKDDI